MNTLSKYNWKYWDEDLLCKTFTCKEYFLLRFIHYFYLSKGPVHHWKEYSPFLHTLLLLFVSPQLGPSSLALLGHMTSHLAGCIKECTQWLDCNCNYVRSITDVDTAAFGGKKELYWPAVLFGNTDTLWLKRELDISPFWNYSYTVKLSNFHPTWKTRVF